MANLVISPPVFPQTNKSKCWLKMIHLAFRFMVVLLMFVMYLLSPTSNPLLSSLYWTTSMKLPASVSSKYAESTSVSICSLEQRLEEKKSKSKGEKWRKKRKQAFVQQIFFSCSYFFSCVLGFKDIFISLTKQWFFSDTTTIHELNLNH